MPAAKKYASMPVCNQLFLQGLPSHFAMWFNYVMMWMLWIIIQSKDKLLFYVKQREIWNKNTKSS